MRRSFPVFLRFACVLALLSGALLTRDVRAQYAAVEGIVKDSVSGRPLARANVTIQGTGRGTTTGEDGRFIIRRLRSNRSYVLVCSHIGYHVDRDTIRVGARTAERRVIKLRPREVNLAEVVVEEKSSKVTEEPNAAYLTPRAVEQLPGALTPDVFRALQKLPGVTASSDYSSDLYIRGSGPGQTLVQLNGAPIYNPSHLLGFFSTFNPLAVSGVRLHKGSYPVKYGGRLGSVVSVETDKSGERELGADLQVGLLDSRTMIEGPLPDGSWMIAARRSNMEPVLAALNERSVEGVPEAFRFHDVNASMDLDLSSDDRLSLTLFRSGDDMYFPFNRNLLFDVNHVNAAGVIDWRHVGADSWLTRVTASASQYSSNSEALLTRAPFSRATEILDVSTRSHAEYVPDGPYDVTAGFELGLQRFDVRDVHGGRTVLDRAKSSLRGAAYLSGSVEMSPRWTVEGGIRSEYYRANRYLRLSPRLSLIFRPHETVRFHLSGGRYHQFLTRVRSQLLSSFDTWLPVNDSLRPAAGDHLSTGFEWAPADELTLGADAYLRRMDGLFRLDPRRSDATGIPYHELFLMGEGYSYGTEVLVETSAGWLSGSASYTYGWTARRYPTINAGNYYVPRHDRRHTLNLAGVISISEDWEASLTYRYATGQPYTRPSAQYELVDSPYMGHNHFVFASRLNEARLPPYQRLDIGLTRRGQLFGVFSYNIKVQVINVLSSDNVWFDLYQPGETSEIVRTRVLQIPVPVPNVSFGVQF